MNRFRKICQVSLLSFLFIIVFSHVSLAQEKNYRLSKYDFLYVGESPTQNLYIITNGEIAWEYKGPRDQGYLGEISDAVLMTNGNILFAHQRGITLMTSEKVRSGQFK